MSASHDNGSRARCRLRLAIDPSLSASSRASESRTDNEGQALNTLQQQCLSTRVEDEATDVRIEIFGRVRAWNAVAEQDPSEKNGAEKKTRFINVSGWFSVH
ncbi:hypothetical protein KOW79_004585 [Hemibagrus wyckioides]|uniref:Uncharacterized protein n=1 Tax=Hemibagrus wyckioides TaxID=337641 RepID=A0A9D3SPT7_9TELE|nr:hypothetical protein KOW79_004585 [Hemibagrus wyckioides]